LAGDDIVFSFGGIGGTPDDLTRECVASAMGVELAKHPDAVREIERQFGEEAYPQRIKMAFLPCSSRIIPNPVNRIPGFSVGNHHFFPGFPQMAWPMSEWVFDRYYPHLIRKDGPVFREYFIDNVREGSLMSVMNTLVAEYPDIRLSSLPSYDENGFSVNLGLFGEPDRVRQATEKMEKMVIQLGYVPQCLQTGG
jgi:molybdopterin-biosynthesis enzyme MoeA-like protein